MLLKIRMNWRSATSSYLYRPDPNIPVSLACVYSEVIPEPLLHIRKTGKGPNRQTKELRKFLLVATSYWLWAWSHLDTSHFIHLISGHSFLQNYFQRFRGADTSICSHRGSSDTSIYAHRVSSDTSIYAHRGSSDTSIYTHRGSSDTSIYVHRGSSESSIFSNRGSSDIVSMHSVVLHITQ